MQGLLAKVGMNIGFLCDRKDWLKEVRTKAWGVWQEVTNAIVALPPHERSKLSEQCNQSLYVVPEKKNPCLLWSKSKTLFLHEWRMSIMSRGTSWSRWKGQLIACPRSCWHGQYFDQKNKESLHGKYRLLDITKTMCNICWINLNKYILTFIVCHLSPRPKSNPCPLAKIPDEAKEKSSRILTSE